MEIEREGTPEFARGELHIPDGIELREVVLLLNAYESAYDELAWLDAGMEQTRSLLRSRADERWQHVALEASAQTLVAFAQDKRFQPGFALWKTRNSLKVATARQGDSWILDLLGKLNPITTLESLLKTIRDWRIEARGKELENSRLAQEVLRKSIENQAGELALLRDAANLLREAGMADSVVRGFVIDRIGSLFPHVQTVDQISAANDIGSIDIHLIEDPRAAGLPFEIRATIERSYRLPDVWGEGNRMFPAKD